MVTGKVPFNADTPVSVALKHMQEEAEEPININPNIPVAVNKIIMKAMQKEISLRYQTATEMLKDLSMALKNPSGDFVVTEKQTEFATQRISTLYDKTENNRNNQKENVKKDNKLVSFIKTHKALSIFIGGILLFVLTIIVTNILLNAFTKSDVQIPDLVGMEQNEAQSKVKELKLKYEKKSEEYNKDIPAGCIISQDPSYIENYKVKEGSTIKVVISLGKNVVKMPKAVGLSQSEAESKLNEVGLKIEIEEEYNNKVEAGYVIEQSVKENEEIDSGETVTLKVSKGIEKVTVPDVLGKSEDDAKSAIKSAGLKLKTTATTEDTTKDDGVVVKQSLEAGSEVEKDSSITITVNKLQVAKEATINVNVKSINNTKAEETKETGTKEIEKVELKITVGNDTVYKEKVNPLVESISQKISGKGTVTVKVYIDGILKKSKDINLNNTTEYIFE